MDNPAGSNGNRLFLGSFCLVLASLAWGTTFVVQRTSMAHLGPFTYSGIRFLLGSLILLPLALYRLRRPAASKSPSYNRILKTIGASFLTGILVYGGINLQQIGLVSSTAGKGGVITGLYVIIVPILASFFGQKPGIGVWLGAPLALIGLYLLSVTGSFTLAPGDGWILACAFVWALQVLSLSWLSPKIDSFILAFGQGFICGILSIITAVAVENINLAAISESAFDLIYGGIVSVGLGYTLQIIGQKYSPASHAALIMQLEAVFAVLSGWIFLGEILTPRAFSGCILMLTGILFSLLLKSKQSPENILKVKSD